MVCVEHSTSLLLLTSIQFLGNARTIADIGKIELSWVPNASTTSKVEPSTDQPLPVSDPKAPEGEIKTGDQTESAAQANGADDMNGNANGGDADYDVADDEDRWMAA
jgi:hypothetical protein